MVDDLDQTERVDRESNVVKRARFNQTIETRETNEAEPKQCKLKKMNEHSSGNGTTDANPVQTQNSNWRAKMGQTTPFSAKNQTKVDK